MSVYEKNINKIKSFLDENIFQFVKNEKKLNAERRNIFIVIFLILISITSINLIIITFHVVLIGVYYFISNSLLIIFSLYFNDNNWLKRNNNSKRWRDYHELVKKVKNDKTELINILIECKLIMGDTIYEEDERDRIRGKFSKWINKLRNQ